MLPLRSKPQEADDIGLVGILTLVGAGALNGVKAMVDVEQTILERAYQLWTEAGCHDGHAETHWLAAQQELLSASVSKIGCGSVSEASATTGKPKKAKTSRKEQRTA